MGWGGWATPSRNPVSRDHPRTPGPTPAGPGQSSPWEAFPGPPRAKGRDSTSFPRNLVKTAECHQKCHKRPVIVPICKKGLKKSPLEILRFLFSPAFSHKELMVPFHRGSGINCQNDEVSLECTHPVTREVVVRYPLGQHCCPIPHLTQRASIIRLFPDILNETVSIRKLGTLRP